VAIDEDCSTIIARRQPAAGDLRMLLMIVKTITDLERIGDEAAKIAHMTQKIYETDRGHIPHSTEVKHVADIALGMLRNALDAFARLDLAVAAKVVRQDEQVDDVPPDHSPADHLHDGDPRTISRAIEVLFIAKAVERIADHAKNMSEYVVYMVKGKDVRHTGVEAIEREALETQR
jgi:phosphate transport system protein